MSAKSIGSPSRRRTKRRRVWALGSVAALIALIVTLCTPIYAGTDDTYNVHDTDAVFILGPPTEDRIALGEKVAREAGGVPVYLSVWHGVVCKPQFVCVHADPWTTVGEAAALEDAVKRDGIRHPLVVTSSVHELRARYIFNRCVSVPAPVIGVHRDLTLGDYVWQPIYQWSAMVKAVLVGCVHGG